MQGQWLVGRVNYVAKIPVFFLGATLSLGPFYAQASAGPFRPTALEQGQETNSGGLTCLVRSSARVSACCCAPPFPPLRRGLVLGAASAQSAEIKIGGLWGVTGPVSKFIPPLKDAADLAAKQVNAQGGLLKGDTLAMVLADTKCDGKTSSAAANKLVNINKVIAINGALCSGATIAAANTVGIPGGVVMISPASTAPAISLLKDKDLIFRVTPPDDFQGKVLARVIKKRGINSIAITYIQNDYGKGLAQALKAALRSSAARLPVTPRTKPRRLPTARNSPR